MVHCLACGLPESDVVILLSDGPRGAYAVERAGGITTVTVVDESDPERSRALLRRIMAETNAKLVIRK